MDKKLVYADDLMLAIRDDYLIDGRNFSIMREHINDAEAVDAVEVVHGQWVNPYMNRYGHPCHCCSICGFKASHQDKNYCPNCGAKMDGGK